ncbi:aminodeoxychorismate synthase component I [Thiorhodococcus mannitoliphagus]|uniref:aminodeoxychorismate synthase n=2 Tax=Thiorhodococcus mannitoliphagus TaxID=329406 RepID=A0A6P1DRI2_9GAMM|nr:aminodeoxychorismate synthase component I [Thiorhodococcus mannitoliphagus]NEX19286.1 aminodeoxychorismate synthase component I [Thiorhodococcus mannitoliphagus]
MSALAVQDFPYHSDSSMLFEALVERAWPVFLDSGRPLSRQGRFDILTADPSRTLMTYGLRTEVRAQDEGFSSLADPFALLAEALGPLRARGAGLPFCGGAIGYFGYDLARRLERLPSRALDAEGIPDMAVGIYDWALVVDHREGRSALVARDSRMLREYRGLLSSALQGRVRARPRGGFRVLDRVVPNMSHGRYLESIARIQDYLRAGDCYQVNFAQRFAVPAEGDPWQAYKALRELNAAPFGAYLGTPECQVLSSSPERFLQVREDAVETKPIKGTRPRGADAIKDLRLADELRQSAKDRAENVMIVDLLRNDLGKVCDFGSVKVPRLFDIESFARVHHLVSTVTGRLAQGRTAVDLLRACFPGGSITGAPKVRAMEIIEELEPHRRGVYCGAIGYLGYDGAMDTNIAIRTLVHSGGTTRLWAGGGIVADSDPESEYRETHHKAAPLLDLLERMRLGHVGS